MTELEQERAGGYALLAQLLQEPDPSLIAALALAPHDSTDPAPLARAWSALVHAAARHGPAAIGAEYAQLFAAAGTPRIAQDESLAALCESMQLLVQRGDAAGQRSFFVRHLAGRWDASLRDIREAPGAAFYRAVANFAHAFLEREAQRLAREPELHPA